MSESFSAFCSDFYVNQNLSLKLDLPRERQTVLDLFDRVRRQFPGMTQFKRYEDELALESEPGDSAHHWLAVRSTSVRSGSVDPAEFADAYALHRHLLEIAPYFLSISALDVDYLELLFGFDIAVEGNHDEVVYDALIAGTPLGPLLDVPDAETIDCQPLLGMTLNNVPGLGSVEANYEVKTRPGPRDGHEPRPHARAPAEGQPRPNEPVSVYLTMRKYGPVKDVKDLPEIMSAMSRIGERLVETRVVPILIAPIREAAGPGKL